MQLFLLCVVLMELVVTPVGSLYELPFLARIFFFSLFTSAAVRPAYLCFLLPGFATLFTHEGLSPRPSACKRVVLQSSGAVGG